MCSHFHLIYFRVLIVIILLFNKFVDYASSFITENGIMYVKTPSVLTKSKEYFSCPDMKGMPLENYGGSGSAGSHWESTFLKNDLMTA